MKKQILFMTEMQLVGKLPKDFPNLRTLESWLIGLDAHHVPLESLHSLKEGEVDFFKYSSVVVVIPKNKPEYLIPIAKMLPANNLVILQEGPCDFFQDLDSISSLIYESILSQCRLVLCHNESDVKYFKQYNNNCKRIKTCTDVLTHRAPRPKLKRVLIGGTNCSWYNGQTSYSIAKIFQDDGYGLAMMKMGRFKDKEELLCDHREIKIIDYEQWSEFILNLSQYSFAVHLMPTKAAGSFYLNCLSKDTEVITENGIKIITDIKIGEKVLSKNMNTGEVEYKKVINTFENPNQQTYHIKSRSIDFIATGNHNMLIHTRDGRRKNNQGHYDRTEFKTVESLYNRRSVKSREKLPDFVKVKSINKTTEEEVDYHKLMGWFISEGCTRDYAHNPYDNRIEICQSKNSKYYNEIGELIKRCGFTPRYADSRIAFSDKKTKQLFIKEIGRTCGIKRIPNYVFSDSTTHLIREAIFEGMMKGDGNAKGNIYATTSEQLAKDMVRLCIMLGYGGNYNKYPGKNEKHADLYNVTIRKHKIGSLLYLKNIRKHKIMDTYCIEIEENHNFIAGRNGKFQFIGNCAMMGVPCICSDNDVAKDLFPYTTVKDPTDYVAGKRIANKLLSDKKFLQKVISHAKLKAIDYDYKLVCNRLSEDL